VPILATPRAEIFCIPVFSIWCCALSEIFERSRSYNICLAWRRAGFYCSPGDVSRAFVPDSLVNPSLHDALGLAGAAIYLLASDTIQTETQLRREGVCAFLISINLYFTIQFVCCGFVEHRRTAAVVSGIVSVFSSILLASARPNFWFVVIVVMVPVAVFFVR